MLKVISSSVSDLQAVSTQWLKTQSGYAKPKGHSSFGSRVSFSTQSPVTMLAQSSGSSYIVTLFRLDDTASPDALPSNGERCMLQTFRLTLNLRMPIAM